VQQAWWKERGKRVKRRALDRHFGSPLVLVGCAFHRHLGRPGSDANYCIPGQSLLFDRPVYEFARPGACFTITRSLHDTPCMPWTSFLPLLSFRWPNPSIHTAYISEKSIDRFTAAAVTVDEESLCLLLDWLSLLLSVPRLYFTVGAATNCRLTYAGIYALTNLVLLVDDRLVLDRNRHFDSELIYMISSSQRKRRRQWVQASDEHYQLQVEVEVTS
jgi:hypothetical protein